MRRWAVEEGGNEGEKEEGDGDGDGGWMFYERLSRQGTVGHWPGVGGPRVRTPERKTERPLCPSSSPPVANSDQTVTITGLSPISSRPWSHSRSSSATFSTLLSPSFSLDFPSLSASRIICPMSFASEVRTRGPPINNPVQREQHTLLFPLVATNVHQEPRSTVAAKSLHNERQHTSHPLSMLG
ncbi:hypothetical protein BC835DRAFT_949947 [Cytidiella melzeri]|nr:hypothetical protein BC835DRAFT_949947 [Cytidiella melzeri]